MNRVTLSRSFLKEGILVLLALILLHQGLSWTYGYEITLRHMDKMGGLVHYVVALIRALLLPELATVLLLAILMNGVRRWFAIKSVELGLFAIGRYELIFLPVMLVAFPLIIPFTQSVRYLLEAFPNYSFANYWDFYLSPIYSWSIYFKYLSPILFIGYTTLNIALILDYLKPSRPSQLN